MGSAWLQLQQEITECRRCPRLVAWREQVAREKKRAFADQDYWGRPVPALGGVKARLLILGLAPAAHGANRTGRMFTGDESGRWLFRALHKARLASQDTSVERGDGLKLVDCVITAAARCAPPDNKPAKEELAACSAHLDAELQTLKNVRVVVTLGKIAWDTYLAAVARMGHELPRPRPVFAHLALVKNALPHVLIGSYHPSQQNTHTGKLTEEMLDSVFTLAQAELGR